VRIKIIRGRTQRAGRPPSLCLLPMFIHGIYECNIMIQSDSFAALNQLFLTAADDQNGKPNWLLSQLIHSKRQKQRTNWLFKSRSSKKLIAKCSFPQMLFVVQKRLKGILSDGRADFWRTQHLEDPLLIAVTATITRWRGPIAHNILSFMVTCF